jgi:molybdopterin converting factor subunit 1
MAQMHVDVLLFASAAEAVGAPRLTLALEPGAVVGDAVQAARDRAGAVGLPDGVLVARNEAYARLDDLLGDGDEVAIIPPVAGG